MVRSTRPLLTAGAVAGPLYVAVSLIEVAVRDGFDPARHAWSMLANGPYGWVHAVTLVVSGLLVVAGATGLSRVPARRGPALLLALYGAGLAAAGLFRADPGRGFPPGTPETVPVTGHGVLHLAVSGIGFLGLAGACLLLGRRLHREDHRRLALFSQVTGVLFVLSFGALAATGGPAWALLVFTAAVILASAWLTVIFARSV